MTGLEFRGDLDGARHRAERIGFGEAAHLGVRGMVGLEWKSSRGAIIYYGTRSKQRDGEEKCAKAFRPVVLQSLRY